MAVPRSADPKSVRFWNEHLVIDVLRTQESPIRISQLVELTGLTPASLGHVLKGLELKGWVATSESPVRRRGRPAQLFSLARPKGCVLGFDVRPRSVRVVSVDLLGRVLRTAEISSEGDAPEALQYLPASVLPEDGGPVWVAAIATEEEPDAASRVDDFTSAIESERERARQIRAQLQEAQIGERLIQMCDGHAAAFAARKKGVAPGQNPMLYLHLGRRPKFCVVSEQGVHLGAHGRAGHLRGGSLLPVHGSIKWPDGACGEGDDGSIQLLVDAVEGDPAALAKVDEYLAGVAPEVAVAVAVMDPGVVVVGGVFAPLQERVVQTLQSAVQQQVGHGVDVVGAGLDKFGVATGAALIARQEIKTLLVSPESGAEQFSIDRVRRLWRANEG
ncbi:MAG: hypothetical protein E7L00_11695 [Propionibacteriaceae bacterium]|nr:hypothetical protein [Propionibacteriaceae bacterium]